MADEVAVFIDLENLRYGMLNHHGQEPDFRAVVEKAKKYGRPSVMRAYADFTEHPPEITRHLQIVGVEAINIPVKRTTHLKGGQAVERVKNAADMVLALDAMTEALEADRSSKSKVFMLVTGDRDYIRLVTLLRNKFGQRVVITGVPGSIASDLVAAAGEQDHLDVEAVAPVDRHVVKTAIVAMVNAGPAPLKFWTYKIIDQWAQESRKGIPGTAKDRRDAIGDLATENVLIQYDVQYKDRTVKAVRLDDKLAKDHGYLV